MVGEPDEIPNREVLEAPLDSAQVLRSDAHFFGELFLCLPLVDAELGDPATDVANDPAKIEAAHGATLAPVTRSKKRPYMVPL